MNENASVTHPFDREEEVSEEQLFTSFCNHLTLGQWELTRVCLRGLHKKRNELKKPLKEILRAIIDQPHHASCGSQSVPSPFHLSWLCLMEYLDLFTDEEDQIPEPIVKKVEFGLLLYLACPNAPQNVIQDIDDYHSQIVYRDPDLFATGVSDFSSSALSFLRSLLSDSPQFGQAVINDLTSKGKGFLKNNQLLQQLYLDVIDDQLKFLDSKNIVEMDSNSSFPISNEGNAEECMVQKSKRIYQMLSYMKPTPEMLDLSSRLDELCKTLINLINGRECSGLDKGTLYSCLLSQSSTYLIEKFCRIENQLRFSAEDHSELSSSRFQLEGLRQIFTVGPAVQVCYTQSFMENRRNAWQYLFFHALVGNHVMENVVETALVFVKEGDFVCLNQLLSPVEFSRLKPLVLLLGWPYCYSCENAKNLLNALWNPMEKTAHPLLYQACQKLAYQVQLVQWCTEKARPLLATSESGSTRHQQASEMFQGLESHSVLHVLHKSVNLANLQEKEVFELLRKRPVFTPLNTDKVKRVSKSLESKGVAPIETLDTFSKEKQDSEIHPEVQRDIYLYHSYCAVRNFMDAVSLSAEEAYCKDNNWNAQSEDSCAADDVSGLSSESVWDQQPSCIQVKDKLEAGRSHLSQVHPLTYRVEILENIFSLLFGTYEDLYEGRTQQIESDDVETMDEESRSLSASNRTGSWESLASSVDLAADNQVMLSSTSQTPESPKKHKETASVTTSESISRRQLFKHERSASDSIFWKRLQTLVDEEKQALTVTPLSGSTTNSASCSGNVFSSKGSSRPAVSDDNDLKCEFVIDDKVVPDMLKTLKECLMDLNSSKFTELQKGNSVQSNSNRQDWLHTSVSPSTMEQRISRLGQYINEAQWRFQLVSWKNETNSRKNKPFRRRSNRKLQRKGSSHELNLKAEAAQDEDSGDNLIHVEEISRKTRSKGAASIENSCESSSQLSQEMVTTEPEENRGRDHRKKIQRHRRTSRASGKESSGLLTKNDSMISRMLSSPDTLIFMCMRKDNYERARQVIKMFNIAEEPSAQAAVFAEKYAKKVKHLESLQPKTKRAMTPGIMKSQNSLGVLGAVAMAAASGSQTSLVSSQIEELLSTPSLAAVLNPSVKPEDLVTGNSSLVKCFDPQFVPTMLYLDLACTVSVAWSTCKALLDMAKSRITKVPPLSSAKPSIALPGIRSFLNQVDELLNQEQSSGKPQVPSGGITFAMTPKSNAMDLLLFGSHPLNPKDTNAHKRILAIQEEAFRRMEQALEEGDTFIHSIDELTKPAPGHKHVGRQLSFKKTEKRLMVRVALVELQEAFSCIRNPSHMTRALGGSLEERYDYVSSLFKHVDSLATLLLTWKSADVLSNTETNMMMSSNPFVVLKEGIAETLGKPLFQMNIPPKELEDEAKKLHINLSKVIVYNCCPPVISQGRVPYRDVHWPSSDPVILNTAKLWTDSVRDPNTVVRDLLSRMIKMLKDVAGANGGVVDAQSADNAIKAPEFQSIARDAAELQALNLDLLVTDTAKACFFVNTLNLLIAHASLIQFADSTINDVGDRASYITRHASFTRLMDSLSSSGGGGEKGGEAVPLTALERIAFLKQHCYFIGQLGVVSAFDLQYVILHKGVVPPSTFGDGVVMCFPERSKDEAKRKYKLRTAEKRIIFAICDGCVSSPQLQVFDVDEFDVQLSAAVVSYINSRVSLNQLTGQVTLPEILHWYRKDFEIRALDTVDSPAGRDVSILLQMEPYLYPSTADKLQQMLPTITEISFTPFCWTFSYRFEPAMLERSSSGSVLQRSNSAPDSLHLSVELSTLARSRRAEKRGLFSLNDAAFEYLEEKSELVAALASLVCSTPRKLESVGKNVENSQKNELGESSNKSTEFPFQVALENTAKFPVLQRYIVCKLYALADMLTLSQVDSDEEHDSGSFGSYDFIKLDSNLQVLQEGVRQPEISLFSVALASEGSRPLQNAILKASDFFLRKGYFDDLVELINSSNLRGDGIAGPPIDFLLISAILSKGGTRSETRDKLRTVCSQLDIPKLKLRHAIHKKPWTLIPIIKQDEQLTQLVLGQLSQWNAKTCIDLIELCLSRPLKNTALREDLERNRRTIAIHQKIAQCARSPQFQTTISEQAESSSSGLKHWQSVAVASEDEPHVVMEFLLSVQQFDLAAEWAEIHVLPKHFHETIKECQLKQLLSHNPDDHMKAYRILEGIQDHDMCLSICDSLLSQNLPVGQTLFIIQFMLTNLSSLLSPVRMERLVCTKMGAKALLCLPGSARPNYEHLVSRPPLLLEQLLMNMKVEWASKVFQRVQVDLGCMEDVECLGDHGCTVKAFDKLLATYSAKALEFQVVQTERSQTRELCSSIMQSLTQTPSSSPTSSTTMGSRTAPFQESGRFTPVTSTPVKERAGREVVIGSLDRKVQTMSRRKISTDSAVLEREKKSQHQSTPPRTVSTARKISQVTAGHGGQQVFTLPNIPPKMADWMPDQQVSTCVICSDKFSMFNRRHHCRRCGRVVCGTCSQHSHVVSGYGKNTVRVCDNCHEFFYSSRPRITNDGFSASYNSDPVPLEKSRGFQDNPEFVASTNVIDSSLERTLSSELLIEDLSARCLWKLSLDDENNAILREEFFYEQAPSASLCVSILDLHSDNRTCGRLILDLCNSLSQKLVPVAPGVKNEELDHNLVISMIRYLLLNAKFKMIKAGETQGVELCDTYLGHVDLMKFLVESNCGDIPSLRDLMHPDSARRLRDRFIEDERLSLAMEVSTKCGLDPSGVWGAAGFALLQAGDFPGAREKFSRCMKIEEGGKQHQQNNSQYLDKIVDILQTSPMLAYQQSTDGLMSPLVGLVENSRNFQPGSSYLDPKRFEECLYYLRKYGSPSSLVAFYVRHGHLKLACRYVIDQQCGAEVFIESLFMRLVLKGNWTQLKEQMETADPTMQAWMPYLTATCKFLLRRSLHHQLLEVQVFMKDFFRAAQTCIRFYEGATGRHGFTSYEELFPRLHYLEEAKRHIEAVIAEKKSTKGTVNTVFAYLRQRGTSSVKGVAEEPSHHLMSISELNSHVNTINLQTEVTNFIHQCAVERGGPGLVRASEGNRLPTLFGNGHVRAEVVVRVLLAGATIQDGFSLASRIIQDFNLPAARVYVDAGRSLARQYKFSHIEDLLRCSRETGQITDKCHDDIILACVNILSADQSQAKSLEALIKLCKSDTNKINAFIVCGKLKSAYLIAVKGNRVEVIREIFEIAMNTGQSNMIEICSKFLNQYKKKR